MSVGPADIDPVLDDRDRMARLLDGVLAIGSGLELQSVLRRIVEAARQLSGAKYGALGTIGPDGKLSQFIHVGLDDDTIKKIGPLPKGRGLLGLLIEQQGHPVRCVEIAQHPAAYGFPPNHPPMGSFLGVPIRVGDEVFGNLYLTDKVGAAEFSEEDEAAVLALATAAGVAISNARLYDESRNRERWLEATGAVTTQLLSGSEPREVLTLIARLALEMAGADLVTIALPGPRPGTLLLEVTEGLQADELRGLVIDMADSLSGRVFSTGEPATVTDLHGDSRVADVIPGAIEIGPCLYVPLGQPPNVRGVLRVGNHTGRPPFAADVLPMLTAFAGQAAIALQLAESRRDAERLGLLEDRDRIARDLHDLVIQRLFAIGMVLEGATRLIVLPEVAERVHRAVDELDQTIKEIRSTIFALQAPVIDEQPSLRARVVQEVEAATPSLGFTPSLQLDGLVDTTVPPEIGEHVLAVLREALSNAARHAHASKVSVLLAVDSVQVQLRVTDDGIGISETGRRSGLRNLAERAEALGGSLEVGPAVGAGGTGLVWRVPLPRD